MSKRISRESLNMSMAKLLSERGTCNRAKVGALITIDNRIISTGYNGVIIPGADCQTLSCDTSNKCQHAMHAEANAIAFAAKAGISLLNSTLWCTHQPCYECSKLIYQAGIKRVIFENPYTNNEGTLLLIRLGIKVQHYEQIKDSTKS